MANKIICKYCGAEFDEELAKCPYCDSTNYKGAEAEYFDKLEDVRDSMEDLEEVPEEETRKAFRKQGSFLKKVFLVIGVIAFIFAGFMIWSDYYYDRDEKSDFLWKEENYPIMNEMYEQGNYEELTDFYVQASAENAPAWDWEHRDFCEAYLDAMSLEYYFEREAAGEPLNAADYASILYYELSFVGISEADLDEQERAILAEYEEAACKDFEERWKMSEEDKAFFQSQLEENGGWVGYLECEDYVEKWYEGQQEEKQ